MDFDAFGKEAMADLLAGNSEAFDKKLRQFDPQTIHELYIRAADLGRSAFRNRQYKEAIEHFSGAIAFAPDSQAKARLFANRAACCLKLNRNADALEEAKKAIALDSSWDKAWYRAACALQELELYESALSVLRKAMKCRGYSDPDDIASSSTSDLEAAELKSRFKTVSDLYNQQRLRNRYQVDYSRFERLANEIVSEEAQTAAEMSRQSEPEIQFSEDLSAEERAALMAQLTGSYDESLVEQKVKESARRLAINLGASADSVTIEHRRAIGRLLQVQHEAQLGSRILSLWDTGVSRAWAHALLSCYVHSHNNCVLQRVGFLGFESLYPLVYLWTKMAQPKPNIDVYRRNLSGAALEVLKGLLAGHESTELLKIQFHLLGGAALKDDKPTVQAAKPSADPDEAQLQQAGAAAIEAVTTVTNVPSRVDLLVIDPESLDNYLVGPRNPIRQLLSQDSPSFTTMFPHRIDVRVQLCRVNVPSVWETPSMESAMRWSLLPQKVSLETLSSAFVRLGEAQVLWTLDAKLNKPAETVELMFPSITTKPNALLFEVAAYSDDNVLIQSELFKDFGYGGSLQPSFWWLSGLPGDVTSITSPTDLSVNFEFVDAMLTRAVVKLESAMLLRSDPIVVNCVDRYQWEGGLKSQTALNAWEAACERNRERVEAQWRLSTTGRSFGWSDTAKEKEKPMPPYFLYLDAGSVDSTQRAVRATLRHRPTFLGISGAVTETNMLVTDGSNGSVRAMKGSFTNSQILSDLRQKCWVGTPAILKNQGQWRGADGKVIEKEVDEAAEASEMRDWLFSRAPDMRPRLDIECGTIRTLRSNRVDPDTRMALCQLYGVPPDTPGLDSTVGCIVTQRPFSSVILGDILTYPSDGLSQGLIPTVLYVRRVLMDRYGTFCPGKLRLMGQLVAFEPVVDGVDIHFMQCLRNPKRGGGGQQTSVPAVPDGSRFHFGHRSEVEWSHLRKSNLASLVGDPIELLEIDLNESDESRFVRNIARDRTLEVGSAATAHVCDGLIVWSEWTFDDSCVIGNPPSAATGAEGASAEPSKLVYLPNPQQLQLLPRRAAGKLKYCAIPSLTDFIVTWDEELTELDEFALKSIESSTSMALGVLNSQQDGLAVQISQHLTSSAAAAKEIGGSVVSLCRSGGDVLGVIEPEILNNVLYAAMS